MAVPKAKMSAGFYCGIFFATPSSNRALWLARAVGATVNFDKENINKLARLARLSLSDEEARRLPDEMASILKLVAQLNELDVSNVKPMSHPGDRSLLLQEDVPHKTLGRACLVGSQGYEDGLIRVPKIIE